MLHGGMRERVRGGGRGGRLLAHPVTEFGVEIRHVNTPAQFHAKRLAVPGDRRPDKEGPLPFLDVPEFLLPIVRLF